jgi:Methyltransferase domain
VPISVTCGAEGADEVGAGVRRLLQRRLFLLTDRFRRRRMAAFVDEFRPTAETRILDVGGTETNWGLVEVPSQIVLLNLTIPEHPAETPSNMQWVAGDGCNLTYGDDEFDICFSNSTIEHLHTRENQRRFAAEVRRVARSYYVQTPARSFPFEPHWLGFFVHWLPRRWQPRIARWGTLYGLAMKPTSSEVRELIDEYRLLSYREMEELFPDAEIRRERFLLMPKSYVAVRRTD